MLRPRIASVAFVVLGCSSGAPTPQQGSSNQYPGDDLGPMQQTKCAANPNGDCYPTTNLGWGVRSGSVPGNRIPNFAFFGYRNADPTTKTKSTGMLERIQLADYYDPSGTKVRLIRIIVGALWCGPCNQEADYLVMNDIAGTFAAQGVVLLNGVNEGATPGIPATTSDLTTWIMKHNLNYTAWLESDDKLGPFWKQDAIPENITIDARSMEVLETVAGFSTGIQAELTKWLTWQKNNPPQQ